MLENGLLLKLVCNSSQRIYAFFFILKDIANEHNNICFFTRWRGKINLCSCALTNSLSIPYRIGADTPFTANLGWVTSVLFFFIFGAKAPLVRLPSLLTGRTAGSPPSGWRGPDGRRWQKIFQCGPPLRPSWSASTPTEERMPGLLEFKEAASLFTHFFPSADQRWRGLNGYKFECNNILEYS